MWVVKVSHDERICGSYVCTRVRMVRVIDEIWIKRRKNNSGGLGVCARQRRSDVL
jgi:hypothetical protein